MDPPQIATEGFSSDSLSERSPEQHIKNLKKSRRANKFFLVTSEEGFQAAQNVYLSQDIVASFS